MYASNNKERTCLVWAGFLSLYLSTSLTCGMSLSPKPIKPTSKQQMPSRRDCLLGLGVGGILLTGNEPAHAARGAFELDSEYYMRSLLGGNKKEGNVLSSQPPEMPPPRELKGPLVPLLLDNNYASSCLPMQVLVQQVAGDSQSVAKSIAQKAIDVRTKAARSFASRAQWDKEDVTDQYYFDLSAYALWKTAAEYLPNYTDRDTFARNVGRRLYDQMEEPKRQPASTTKGSLVESEAEVFAVLRAFQTSNFCKGFKVGNDQSVGKKQEEKVFDQLDDEAIQSGASVDCLVSVYEPATLGASLQITGEQSRFAPDFVGATLAALWESKGVKCSWEIFFVDQEYRPNPKDYFPDEKLLQFTLKLQ